MKKDLNPYSTGSSTRRIIAKPPGASSSAGSSARPYGVGHATETRQQETNDDTGDWVDAFVHGMIASRKVDRDLQLIAEDPARLAGFGELPPYVQQMAKTDPVKFWMLWQLSQTGVDLIEMEKAQDEMQRTFDEALRLVGWDGTSAPTDKQFEQAGDLLKQEMMEEMSVLAELLEEDRAVS